MSFLTEGLTSPFESHTAIILSRMIGRRTNNDIKILLERYKDKMTTIEYNRIFLYLDEYGIEEDETHRNHYEKKESIFDLDLLGSKEKYRKNIQSNEKGKPKIKR